jgi:hypothetical protein
VVTIWLIINFLLIIGMVVWSFLHETDGIAVQIATVFSQTAVILFLLNINMYFIFLIIRKAKSRKIKLTLAKISRKVMKLHVPIAITASSLIVLHIFLILLNVPLDLSNLKMLTGLIAVCSLVFTLFAGLLRRWKASGFRRKSHIVTAFLFFLFALLHVFSS